MTAGHEELFYYLLDCLEHDMEMRKEQEQKHLEELRGLTPPPGFRVARVVDADGDADDSEACDSIRYIVVPESVGDHDVAVKFIGSDAEVWDEYWDELLFTLPHYYCWGETPEEAIQAFNRVRGQQ